MDSKSFTDSGGFGLHSLSQVNKLKLFPFCIKFYSFHPSLYNGWMNHLKSVISTSLLSQNQEEREIDNSLYCTDYQCFAFK